MEPIILFAIVTAVVLAAIIIIDRKGRPLQLDKDHATPMMDTIAKLREKYDLHMMVERYTSAEAPETENKFIRK